MKFHGSTIIMELFKPKPGSEYAVYNSTIIELICVQVWTAIFIMPNETTEFSSGLLNFFFPQVKTWYPFQTWLQEIFKKSHAKFQDTFILQLRRALWVL